MFIMSMPLFTYCNLNKFLRLVLVDFDAAELYMLDSITTYLSYLFVTHYFFLVFFFFFFINFYYILLKLWKLSDVKKLNIS